MKVSVIVPVYNTERYLRQCIDSILQQSYSDFEILLVDDGSTDDSGKILDEYARKDNRIRVFHQSNRGVTAARKCGVVHSTGEYICFVDSDDTITQDAIQDLLHATLRGGEKVDVVACTTGQSGFISGDEFVSLILVNQINPELWGKLYRKSIFDNCQSLDLGKDYPIGEDYLANLEVGLKTKRITCLPKSVYNYRYNPSSAINTRTYTLAYEEKFRVTVKQLLGNRITDFEEAWYRFQLRTLENLIVNRVKFSYRLPWIKELLKTKHNYTLSVRQIIITLVHNAVLCRFILSVELKLKKLIKHQ